MSEVRDFIFLTCSECLRLEILCFLTCPELPEVRDFMFLTCPECQRVEILCF